MARRPSSLQLQVDWKGQLSKKLVAARGLESQASLASRTRVSDRTIGLIEQQQLKSPPRVDTLAKLAIATGSNPYEWLEIIGERVSEDFLEGIRGAVRVKVMMEQLEPAEKIKREIKEHLEARLASFAPSTQLREELRQYVDERVG